MKTNLQGSLAELQEALSFGGSRFLENLLALW